MHFSPGAVYSKSQNEISAEIWVDLLFKQRLYKWHTERENLWDNK